MTPQEKDNDNEPSNTHSVLGQLRDSLVTINNQEDPTIKQDDLKKQTQEMLLGLIDKKQNNSEEANNFEKLLEKFGNMTAQEKLQLQENFKALAREISEILHQQQNALREQLESNMQDLEMVHVDGNYSSDRVKGLELFLQKAGQSPLGKHIFQDMEAFSVGALDSAVAVAKILVRMVVDLLFLPRDMYQMYKK